MNSVNNKKRIQGKRWCFTINNPPVGLYENINYGIYGMCQMERGALCGTQHIQGFCIFSSNMSDSAMKKIHCTAHWELMKGSIESNEDYCSKLTNKDGSVARDPGYEPRVWGERPKQVGQGHRSDLREAASIIVSTEGSVQDKLDALVANQPELMIKYSRGLRELAERSVKKVEMSVEEFRPWQSHLLHYLATKPHERNILWVFDPIGNSGKSYFVRYMMCRDNKSICLNGRVENMTYAYNGEANVFFDIPRTAAEHCEHLYDMGEKLKSGFYLSTKYEARPKVFPIPHVVFFANFIPNWSYWSEDRYLVLGIRGNSLYYVPFGTNDFSSCTISVDEWFERTYGHVVVPVGCNNTPVVENIPEGTTVCSESLTQLMEDEEVCFEDSCVSSCDSFHSLDYIV